MRASDLVATVNVDRPHLDTMILDPAEVAAAAAAAADTPDTPTEAAAPTAHRRGAIARPLSTSPWPSLERISEWLVPRTLAGLLLIEVYRVFASGA